MFHICSSFWQWLEWSRTRESNESMKKGISGTSLKPWTRCLFLKVIQIFQTSQSHTKFTMNQLILPSWFSVESGKVWILGIFLVKDFCDNIKWCHKGIKGLRSFLLWPIRFMPSLMKIQKEGSRFPKVYLLIGFLKMLI